MQKGEIWILKKENSDYAPEIKILEVFETNVGKKQEMVKVKPVKSYSKTYISKMSIREFSDKYEEKKTRKKKS